MAKRRSPAKRPTKKASVAPSSPPLPPPPAAEEDKPRRLTQVVLHVVKSAADYMLQHVWGLVGGAILASLIIPLWLYIKAGRAAWSYSGIKYVVTFVAGWVSLTLLVVVLSMVQRHRRRRDIEQEKNARFASKEKGYLDHIKNQKRGWKEFNSILPELNKQIKEFGKIAQQTARWINLSTRFLGDRGANVIHVIATRSAKKLNKRADIMEQILERLNSVSVLLFESNMGYVRWFTPTTPEQRQKFENERQGMIALRSTALDLIPVMEGFRVQQTSVRGITTELNTAANRMEHATTNLITFLKRLARESQQIVDEISAKLD